METTSFVRYNLKKTKNWWGLLMIMMMISYDDALRYESRMLRIRKKHIRAIRPPIGMKWYITHWLLRTFKSSSSILKSPTIKTTFQHFCVQHFSNNFRKLFISLNVKRCFGHEILALCRLCQCLSVCMWIMKNVNFVCE